MVLDVGFNNGAKITVRGPTPCWRIRGIGLRFGVRDESLGRCRRCVAEREIEENGVTDATNGTLINRQDIPKSVVDLWE